MKPSIDTCCMVVGGLLLEQAPKAFLLSDAMLETYYEPALQNFKDLFIKDFEAPGDFKQKVMDNVRQYLDITRMRFQA